MITSFLCTARENQTGNPESGATHKAAYEKEERDSIETHSIPSKPTSCRGEPAKQQESESRRKYAPAMAQNIYRGQRKSYPVITNPAWNRAPQETRYVDRPLGFLL